MTEQNIDQWKKTILEETQQKFGSIPPQWVVYPNYHPYSAGWRMGCGEDYQDVWREWFAKKNFTFEQKVAYFQQYELPHAWLKVVVVNLYNNEFTKDYYKMSDDEFKPYFAKAEKLGFASFDDWEKDMDSDRWD